MTFLTALACICLISGRCFTDSRHDTPLYNDRMIKRLTALLLILNLQACTILAIADAAGSAVVYGAKTAVNVLDAVTPDIINKKKKD